MNLQRKINQQYNHTINISKSELVDKAIGGEAPLAKESIEEEKRDYTNTWHEVKFLGKEGYIFSRALEIEGEDKDSVIKKITEKAKELNFEIPLALAIAQTETEFFPYAVSEYKAKGLFQIKQIAQDDIGDEFVAIDIFNIEQNTEVGLRYFLKLKNHYYKNDSDKELKAIAAYRAGLKAIKSGVPLNQQELSNKTKCYLEKVLEARENYKKKFENGKIRLFLLVGLVGTILIGGILTLLAHSSLDIFFQDKEIDSIEREFDEEPYPVEKTLRTDLDGDKKLDEVLFKEEWEKVRGLTLIDTNVFLNGKFIYDAGGDFRKARAIDFENDGRKEIILEVIGGQVSYTTIFYYEDDTLKVAKNMFGRVDYLESESGIEFIDKDGDKDIDIIITYNFDNPSDCLASSAEIYCYYQGKLIKYMDAKVTPDWCEIPPWFWGI